MKRFTALVIVMVLFGIQGLAENITSLTSASVTFSDAFWSNKVDNNNNSYTQSRSLNLTLTFSEGTLFDVKIQYTTSSGGPFTYVNLIGNYANAGTGTVVINGIGTNTCGGELPRDVYDFTINVYEFNTSNLLAQRSYSSDTDLDNQKFEILSDDNSTSSTAPAVTVSPAANITTRSARLSGTVGPNGISTTYYFEFGKTTGYGSKTAEVSAGAGSSPVTVHADIDYLDAGTAYHYRLVAKSTAGTGTSPDSSFSTAPLNISMTAPSSDITVTQGTNVTLTWSGSPSSGTTVTLIRDSNNVVNGNSSEVKIALSQPASGSYSWSTASVPAGTYYIAAMINDSNSSKYSYAAGKVTITSKAAASIAAKAPEQELAGSEFWVDIKAGEPNEINNLFGVSFVLNYNTAYLDYVSWESGSCFGTDLVISYSVYEPEGKFSLGLSRKAPLSGVSGNGVIARVKFKVINPLSSNTTVNFTLTDITANDPNGANIPLSPVSGKTDLIQGITVWPGDNNNDGKVDQADVLPIGVYWNASGPVRQNASTQWTGQICAPWSPLAATYTDANGSGLVDQTDVLAIGQNWGKTHTLSTKVIAEIPTEKTAPGSAISLKSAGKNNESETMMEVKSPSAVNGEIKNEFDVNIDVDNASNLLGASFILNYNSTYLDYVSSTAGSCMGSSNDIIFYPAADETSGKVSIGITRKGTSGGISGSGNITSVRFKISDLPAQTASLSFSLSKVTANDPNGSPIQLNLKNCLTQMLIQYTGVDDGTNTKVSYYSLEQNYPNPFNPVTVIRYSLPSESHVKITVLNLLGQIVCESENSVQSPGYHSVIFNARNLSSGVYYYILEARAADGSNMLYKEIKKMMVMK